MRRLPLIAILLVASSCSLQSDTTPDSNTWCADHRAEVLIADEIGDADELIRLVNGASTARMARRIQSESEFLLQHGAGAMPPLEMLREMEDYASDSESEFSGFSEDVWSELRQDADRYETACARAYQAHNDVMSKAISR